MTTSQADMLLDSYYRARNRRNDLRQRQDVSDVDRQDAEDDYARARETLVSYLKPMEFRS